MLVADYEYKKAQHEFVMEEIGSLCRSIPESEQMLAVKGMGVITVSVEITMGEKHNDSTARPPSVCRNSTESYATYWDRRHAGTRRGRFGRYRKTVIDTEVILAANNQSLT